jgi:anthranilate phosphoribosyltransferase
LKDGEVHEFTVTPQQFGLQSASLDSIRVSTVDEAKAMLLGVLNNQPGAARDIVQLNAGAAIYAAGLTSTLAEGVTKAATVIASGAAKHKLAELIQVSHAA